MLMRTLGQRARERREKMGYSQTKVGEECGVSQESIRQMEADELQRPPRYITKLAKALETTVEWLESEDSNSAHQAPLPQNLKTARQEVVCFIKDFVDNFELLSDEAKHLVPAFVLPALGLTPKTQLVIQMNTEDEVKKSA